MASITSPSLNNAIRTDVPAINAILKALAKSDPSSLTDIENGTKRIVALNGKWNFQELVDGSWVTRTLFNIDATSLDGKTASVDATANTIPLRDSNGALAGNITGNAATASKATALASTLAVSGGGTGATTAANARTKLGVPPTSHAAANTTYGAASASNYGHAKASATTPKALGTAAVGSETGTFARGDHVHPTTTATGSVLGMVKLSDSTTSTSAASAGIAASPKAVKAAYDRGSTGVTNAATAQTTANNAAAAAAKALPLAGTGIAVSTADNGTTVSLASGVVTAAKRGPTANATLTFGGTFSVPYIQYDAYGRVIAGATRTMTMPTEGAGSVTTRASGQSTRAIRVRGTVLSTDTPGASGVSADDYGNDTGSGNISTNMAEFRTNGTIGAGTYTINNLLIELAKRAHTHQTGTWVVKGNCDCQCDCDCSGGDNCFIFGKFLTTSGWKEVADITVGDYIFDTTGTPRKVVYKSCGDVLGKRVIHVGEAVFTADHILLVDNTPTAFDIDGAVNCRHIHDGTKVVGEYLVAPEKPCLLPHTELFGEFTEHMVVVESSTPVWANFSGVTVQLAIRGE